MNRIVGERLSPLPISIGESAFSARTLISMTPAMTSRARSMPCSARARTTAGATARGRPIQGMKLRKKVKMPHIRKVNPEYEHQDNHTRPGNEVDYGTQPELAHHVPAEDGQAHHLRAIPARAGVQPVHHGRSLCEKEQHDYKDEEEVAQEVGDPGEHAADGSARALGFTASRISTFDSPRVLARS